jgi:hypothetical protein
VEFTPQAYLPADLDMFFKCVPAEFGVAIRLFSDCNSRNFSATLVGSRPISIFIDGGSFGLIFCEDL